MTAKIQFYTEENTLWIIHVYAVFSKVMLLDRFQMFFEVTQGH